MIEAPFPYSGPSALGPEVIAALHRVIDPEMGLDIVDLGLVYGVTVGPSRAHVRLTMTSAECPVAELIVEDVVAELGDVLGTGAAIDAELVWDPPWTPSHMSARARSALGW